MRRLAAAGALAIGVTVAATPPPASACSWVQPPLSEVAASADHVFVGVVAEVPAPQTYVVEVERLFRGAPPASMTFRPDPADGLTTCMVLRAGERYVIGTDRVEGPLGVGQVWYHLVGPAANGVYLLNWTGTVDELFAELDGLPDTALPRQGGARPNAAQLAGTLLILFGAAVTIRRTAAPVTAWPGAAKLMARGTRRLVPTVESTSAAVAHRPAASAIPERIYR